MDDKPSKAWALVLGPLGACLLWVSWDVGRMGAGELAGLLFVSGALVLLAAAWLVSRLRPV